jgi:hypothetical protein
MKKLFCVTFTSRDEWDSPTILFIRTDDRDKALEIASHKMEYSEDEVDDMVLSGEYDYLIVEVDDVIDDESLLIDSE